MYGHNLFLLRKNHGIVLKNATLFKTIVIKLNSSGFHCVTSFATWQMSIREKPSVIPYNEQLLFKYLISSVTVSRVTFLLHKESV